MDLLVARGRLTGLSPLARPLRRIDIAQAVLNADEASVWNGVESDWAQVLLDEFDYEVGLLRTLEEQDLRFGGAFDAGLKGVTQRHRDLPRPEGDEALWPTLDLRLRGEAPHVAGVFHGRWDEHLLNDPQFPNGDVVPFRECDPLVAHCAYRVEEAYVEVQTPYVGLFFGRMYRNWGLPGTEGLIVSNYAYTYDHVGYRFGSSRLTLRGLFAPLNDFRGDTARYVSAHRLDWQVRDNLAVSLGEAVIYAGEHRRLDLNLTNPVGVYEISASADGETNTMGTVEVWWRVTPGVLTYGALLVDNTRVGEANEASGLTQWGLHLTGQFPALSQRLAARADFSMVNSLAYRSRVDRSFSYTVSGLSMGRDKVTW